MGLQVVDQGRALQAIAPVVRLLCEVRLVVLLIAVVAGGSTWWHYVVALLAAPCSYLPARHWARQGGRFSTSGLYLGVDTLVAIALSVVFASSETSLVYVGATVTLLGVVAGRTIALLGAVTLGSTLVLVGSLGEPTGSVGFVVTIVAALGSAVLALAGDALGTSLRSQVRTADLLAAERATRVADLERLSVARDVHDSVAGSLAGLALMTGALHRQIERQSADADLLRLAEQVRDASRIAHADTRAVLDQLRQLDPDPVSTLEQVCRRWSFVVGVPAAFAADGDAPLDGAHGVALKAVLTELLENVRKHARATRVDVRLVLANDRARLVVVDDGVGICPGAPGMAQGHYGLVGLTERVDEAGGAVVIESRPGRTSIDVELRVRAAERVES